LKDRRSRDRGSQAGPVGKRDKRKGQVSIVGTVSESGGKKSYANAATKGLGQYPKKRTAGWTRTSTIVTKKNHTPQNV